MSLQKDGLSEQTEDERRIKFRNLHQNLRIEILVKLIVKFQLYKLSLRGL